MSVVKPVTSSIVTVFFTVTPLTDISGANVDRYGMDEMNETNEGRGVKSF